MNKVLVTTDFSANSKAGIKFAIQLASQSKCDLVFYHNIEILQPTSWSPEKYHAFARIENERATKKLQAFVAGVYKSMKLVPGKNTYVTEIGVNVSELVIAYAKKIKADFICLGTRGASGVKKLFGTHASNLINHSPIPVFAIPKSYKASVIKNIWYSSDFENVAREINQLEPVAKALKANVEVHHYNYLLADPATKTMLETAAKKLSSKTVSFAFHVLGLDYSLTHYLEKDIKKKKPSIVALFTKQNKNWFSRLFLGSNSAEMSFASHTPLLIFRKTK